MHNLALPKWDTVIRWSELPGEGRPILCLPGLSSAALPTFLPMMMQPELRGRRALMVDYIGSGLSGHSALFGSSLAEHLEAVVAVLEAAGTGPVCVLGHSMGGTVGIALAFARPDLVARLIVCEGNVTPGGGAATRAIAGFDREDFVNGGYAEMLARRHAAVMAGDVFANFLEAARGGVDPGALHDNSVMLVALEEGFEARFLALRLERHFVYGERSFPGTTGKVTPDAPDPDLLRAHGVGVHVVPGVGHGLMAEDAAGFAQVVGPVLRQA